MLKNAQDVDLAYQFAKNLNQEVENGKVKTRAFISMVIPMLIQSGKKAKRFRENPGIKYPSREGLFVIFGYPSVKYNKGILRTFASENKLN